MKQDLIEALKRLARGHVDAAETVADLLMPEAPTFDVTLSGGTKANYPEDYNPADVPAWDAKPAAKKKAK